MSVVPGPVLISIGAILALVTLGWLFSAWLQDHYSIPLSGADDHLEPKTE